MVWFSLRKGMDYKEEFLIRKNDAPEIIQGYIFNFD